MNINKYPLLVLSVIVLLASPIYAFEVPATISGSSSPGYENPYVLSAYDVYIHPVGLPPGSVWNVTVSGTTYTSSSDLISFTLQSGQYTFTAATRATGISWDNAFNTFTVNDSSTNVSVYFTQDQYIGNTTVQSEPVGIAFDPYNNYIYVTNCVSSTVSVINPSNVVIKNISVQSEPAGIAFDPYNNYIYVTNYGSATVSVINQSNVVIKNISVKAGPFGIAFDPYNNYMYVANSDSATVSVINQSNVVIKNISVRSNPAGIAFDPYNNYMYVANLCSYTVSVIDQSNVVIKNISVRSNPAGIAFDPYNNYVYVTNYGSGTVSILSSTYDIAFYTVEFNENGLPTGTTWNITLSGAHYSSDGNIISIPLTPAEYTYSAMNSNSSFLPVTGTFTVSNNMIVNVQFQEKKYQVTFTETGLPSGTAWYVNLSSGQSFQSTTDTISFMEPNGSYHYTISSMEGRTYSSSLSNGTFLISGSSYSTSIIFSEIKYQITFNESGFPSGTAWYVNLSSGQSFQSTTDTISFMEPNGSYTYILGYPGTWSVSDSNNTIYVHGSTVNISAVFLPVSFQVLIIENGLPSGTTWKVSLQSNTAMTRLASSTYLTFDLQNGTYSYAFSTTNSNYMDENAGQFTVNGNAITVYANFTEVMYNVSLEETGLPSGMVWFAALDNSSLFSSYSTQNAFQLPNGTYYVTATSVGYLSNFTGSATHIVVTIHGSALVYHVTFTKVSAKVPATTSDLLIAAGSVAGIVAGIAAGYLIFRKKK